MLVLHGLETIPETVRHAAVAIGNFDGVHRGHQVLIGRAIQSAKAAQCPAGVMVFEPHPREYFNPEQSHFRLTPLAEKLAVFEQMGLDFAIVVPFDAQFAQLDAERFSSRVLFEGLAVRHVVIGYDFFYGKGRGGSPGTMTLAGQDHGFDVTIFSSTAIRLKLAQGDVAGAEHGLGRRWSVTGKVVGGAKRGTGLGYPTANVPMPKGTTLGHGIYAVRAHVMPEAGTNDIGETHDAAAYLGTRPTFDDGMPVLEVFLFDFDGDLYGQTLRVEFVGFVRGDRKFDSADALVVQMNEDVAKVREILRKATSSPSKVSRRSD
jgi:riboflavin kinase / FMN adenylyltransferase